MHHCYILSTVILIFFIHFDMFIVFWLSRLACFVCFLNDKKYLLFNADDPLNKKHLSLGF
ncbi:hypothetical protein SEEACDC1_20887 [Salmonella enterica subsp. enterica serovar Agona str. SA-1]|nr:hypothetical protein SEEACDC1_20887 [Salmonella enterica subsp. enterica serovar Agona str. SA-1]